MQGARNSRDNSTLQLWQVAEVFFKTVGPNTGVGSDVGKLRVDSYAALIALHRTFEHVADAKILADLLGVDDFAFVSEGGVASDDEAVADARQTIGKVLSDAVGEIILRGIAGRIREGQHDHRKMRR